MVLGLRIAVGVAALLALGGTACPAASDRPGETASALSDAVWVVFQDSSGAHWFGSRDQGAFRYADGELRRFTTRDGLLDDAVSDIQEGSGGDIFIVTNDGVNRFDGRSFLSYSFADARAAGYGQWRLDPGDLWFKGGEPFRFDGTRLHALQLPKCFEEDAFFARSGQPASSPYAVYTIYRDRRGSLWFGTAMLGLCRYDGTGFAWLYEDHLTNVPEGGSFGIRSIYEDAGGAFWVCNTHHRYRSLPDTADSLAQRRLNYVREPGIDQLTGLPADNPLYYQGITDDRRGDIWMSPYGGGVFRYDGAAVRSYPVRFAGADITMVSIYRDRDDVIWVGTHEHGAYRFDGTQFTQFVP